MSTINPLLQVFTANAQTAVQALISSDGIRTAAAKEIRSGRFSQMENTLQPDAGPDISSPSVPNNRGNDRNR